MLSDYTDIMSIMVSATSKRN